MKATNIRWDTVQGYPVLRCEIDGRPATIAAEQKPTLTALRAVYVGEEFPEYSIEIPADPAIARAATTVTGAVQDEGFWNTVFLPFARAVGDGSFRADS